MGTHFYPCYLHGWKLVWMDVYRLIDCRSELVDGKNAKPKTKKRAILCDGYEGRRYAVVNSTATLLWQLKKSSNKVRKKIQ